MGHGRGGIVVNQTFAPNLAGNAVDRMEMYRFGAMVRQDTIATINQIAKRK
jgi:hypothetical protein